MSVPKLRFKADDGSEFPEWEKKKLSDIAEYASEGINACDVVAENYVSTENILKDFGGIEVSTEAPEVGNLRKFKAGDILMSNIRPYLKKIWLADKGGACNADVLIIRPKVGIDPAFLYALLARNEFILYVMTGAKGSKMPRGDKAVTMNYNVPDVCLAEQQKIAVCLSTLDSVIEHTTSEIAAWEKQKRGVMQLLFSRKVRFKEDDGSEFPEWEEIKLEKILNEYTEMSEKNRNFDHASLTKEGVVFKTERFNRDFLVKDDNKKYRVTHLNDICYNPANLKFGVICRNKLGDVIFSPIYITFKVNMSYDPIFIEYLVTRPVFINYALRYEEGTVYERMAVKPEDLLSLVVKVPSLLEQQKIAACLSAFDEVIDKTKKELEAYRELKKGLLQQMFV